jgi:hypothetical protein
VVKAAGEVVVVAEGMGACGVMATHPTLVPCQGQAEWWSVAE